MEYPGRQRCFGRDQMKLVKYVHYFLSSSRGGQAYRLLSSLRNRNLEPLLVPEVGDKSSTVTTLHTCLLRNTQHSLDRLLGTHRTFEMRCICNELRDHWMIRRRYFKSATGSLTSAIVMRQLTQVSPRVHKPWADR